MGHVKRTGFSVLRTLCGRNWQWAAFRASFAILLVSLVASIGWRGAIASPARAVPGQAVGAPSTLGQPRVVWLDQGWAPDEREIFHHESQGTLTIPIERSWFLALQRPSVFNADAGMFSDSAYLQRFGFIPSPQSASNPDGLPIGFARSTGTDPATGKPFDQFGFTCAACHTARIDYQATTILIDGGPAMIDLTEFGTQLAVSVGETYASALLNTGRFDRFARRVLGASDTPLERSKLRAALKRFVDTGILGFIAGLPHSSANVPEGPGRLDALNRIGNTVFGDDLNIPENRVPTSAPVAYPHIWDTSWFAWVQYNGSIQRPMVRNAGEAMGVSALVNMTGTTPPRFTSSIPIGRLDDPIERLVAGADQPQLAQRFTGLRAPAWPADVFGPIDPVLAARGAEIYRDKCQSCHLPAPNTPEFWSDPRWTAAAANPAGQRYLDLRMVPISIVGTDPAQAEDMKKRVVRVPVSFGLPNSIGSNGNMKLYSFGGALGNVVDRVVEQWYNEHLIPPVDRERMNGYRDNGIRDLLAYKARPLDGIWATAPYLHNGSVPTLWALLSPYAERPATFRLGGTNFDPKLVGYTGERGSLLRTSRRGNFNTGHLFDSSVRKHPGTLGDAIPVSDRLALLEYLKSL